MLHIRLKLQRPSFALDVDLQLPAHGVSVIWGASGSGKTTLLRAIAGLDAPDPANNNLVQIGQHTWQDDAQRIALPTWQRRMGYVFQEASLFEHLSVKANLHYGLRRLPTAQQNPAALQQAIEVLGIGHLLQRPPNTLSGGERQRVALARALALQPHVLLLDEPLAALDTARKNEVLPWLEKLRSQVPTPMLYVTHSADEVTRLADHLVVLQDGQVHASGAIQTVLANTAIPIELSDDVGALLLGHVAEHDSPWGLTRISLSPEPSTQLCAQHLWISNATHAPVGTHKRLRVLAKDISISLQHNPDSSIQNHLACRISALTPETHKNPNSTQCLVGLECGGQYLIARISARAVHQLQLQLGMQVWAQVKAASLST